MQEVQHRDKKFICLINEPTLFVLYCSLSGCIPNAQCAELIPKIAENIFNQLFYRVPVYGEKALYLKSFFPGFFPHCTQCTVLRQPFLTKTETKLRRKDNLRIWLTPEIWNHIRNNRTSKWAEVDSAHEVFFFLLYRKIKTLPTFLYYASTAVTWS